jgi:hypothetical protein
MLVTGEEGGYGHAVLLRQTHTFEIFVGQTGAEPYLLFQPYMFFALA